MAISEHYARELINRALPIWIDIHTNDRGYYEKKRSLLCALKRKCLDEAMAAYRTRMDKSNVSRNVIPEPEPIVEAIEPTIVAGIALEIDEPDDLDEDDYYGDSIERGEPGPTDESDV